MYIFRDNHLVLDNQLGYSSFYLGGEPTIIALLQYNPQIHSKSLWNWGTRVLRTRKHEIYCEIVSPRNDKNYSHKISQHDCQNVRRTKATTEDMLAWTESLESLAPTHTKIYIQ